MSAVEPVPNGARSTTPTRSEPEPTSVETDLSAESGFWVETAEGRGVVVPNVGATDLEASFKRLTKASQDRLRVRAKALRSRGAT